MSLYYIPTCRFYIRDLVYVKEISSILWRCIIYRDLVYTKEISYMKSRSNPFFGVVLYTEISFIQTRSRIFKRDLVHFMALYYIPRYRLYKRDLVYVNEISSILWHCIIFPMSKIYLTNSFILQSINTHIFKYYFHIFYLHSSFSKTSTSSNNPFG